MAITTEQQPLQADRILAQAAAAAAADAAAAAGAAAAVAAGFATSAVIPSAVAVGEGIDPTGAEDSTAALQAKIDGLPDGGLLYIPDGFYLLSAKLTVERPCTIRGESLCTNWLGISAGGSFDVPLGDPPLLGAVLIQTAPGEDGILISGSGVAVNLENIGVVFTGDDVRWVNTGHGFNATPTETVTNGHGTAPDHGLINASWRNVMVYGHDGSHYGVELINSLLCTIEYPRFFGGGGIEALSPSVSGNYGNLVVIHPYNNLFCEGSAHGYHFDGSAATGGYGLLNMITMIRPQCNGEDLTTIFPTTTAPNPAVQHLILVGDTNAVDRYGHVSPDFESPIGMPCDLGESRGHFVDVTGTPELAGQPTLTKAAILTASVGSAATLSGSATDNAGFISVTVGATPVASAFQTILTVMWEHRDSGNYDDIVIIGPRNGNAPSVGAYLQMIAGGFELRVSANLVAGEQYTWNYMVGTGNVLNT